MDNGLPVPMSAPPQLPVNHLTIVPEPPVTDKLMLPPAFEQKASRSVLADVGAVANEFTPTVIG